MRAKQLIYLSLFAVLNLGTVSAQSVPGPQVSGIPVLIPVIAVITVVLLGTAVYLAWKKYSDDPEARLKEIIEQVEDELMEGETIDDSHVSEEIDMAEDALDNGDYERASEIMADIEQKIE